MLVLAQIPDFAIQCLSLLVGGLFDGLAQSFESSDHIQSAILTLVEPTAVGIDPLFCGCRAFSEEFLRQGM